VCVYIEHAAAKKMQLYIDGAGSFAVFKHYPSKATTRPKKVLYIIPFTSYVLDRFSAQLWN
jgi:hypothetical protein